jgi:hypothetical protein
MVSGDVCFVKATFGGSSHVLCSTLKNLQSEAKYGRPSGSGVPKSPRDNLSQNSRERFQFMHSSIFVGRVPFAPLGVSVAGKLGHRRQRLSTGEGCDPKLVGCDSEEAGRRQ